MPATIWKHIICLRMNEIAGITGIRSRAHSSWKTYLTYSYCYFLMDTGYKPSVHYKSWIYPVATPRTAMGSIYMSTCTCTCDVDATQTILMRDVCPLMNRLKPGRKCWRHKLGTTVPPRIRRFYHVYIFLAIWATPKVSPVWTRQKYSSIKVFIVVDRWLL